MKPLSALQGAAVLYYIIALIMLKLTHITFRYGNADFPALDNLNMEINQGESVAVMGANGSGKTTFVRIVAGLLEPLRGQLQLGGREGGEPVIGMLFQNPDNQIVAVTVEKEIAFTLENLGVDPIEMHKRVDDQLKRFRIEKLRNRLTSELSGGEKQRVALASVMVTEPDILLLDEPDSFLDQKGKASLQEELQHLRKQHPEMIQIHITQYPQVAQAYDRMLVFHQGALVADEKPDRIFENEDFCRKCGLLVEPQSMIETKEILQFGNIERNTITKVDSLKAKRISFSFVNDQDLIKHLSLDLHSGEVVSVIGESGCGKSTLSLLLCGLIDPQLGERNYYDNNSVIIEPKSVAGRVVTVLQQPERQFFLSTVAEELRFGPSNIGVDLDDSSIANLLDLVGLSYTQFASRDPLSLSGGEKRRLAFATLLATDPDIIIFDEPTCGLDPSGVGLFVELVKRLKVLEKGIMIITHDGDIVETLSDSVLVMGIDRSSAQIMTEMLNQYSLSNEILSSVSWSRNFLQ